MYVVRIEYENGTVTIHKPMWSDGYMDRDKAQKVADEFAANKAAKIKQMTVEFAVEKRKGR